MADGLQAKGKEVTGTALASAAGLMGLMNSSGVELSGGGYARWDVAGRFTAAATTGIVSNAIVIDGPKATAAWGTAAKYALYNNAGNLLYQGSLDHAQVIVADDFPHFDAGVITITPS